MYRRGGRECAPPPPLPAQVRMLVSSIDRGWGEGKRHPFVLTLTVLPAENQYARREPHRRSLCSPHTGETPYLWREKIHAVLRFRVHGHTVEPKDFAGESWMRNFANEQAAR